MENRTSETEKDNVPLDQPWRRHVCRPATLRLCVARDAPAEDFEANRRRCLEVRQEIKLEMERTEREYQTSQQIFQHGGPAQNVIYDGEPSFEDWPWWKDFEQAWRLICLDQASRNDKALRKRLEGVNKWLDQLEEQQEIVPNYLLMEFEADLTTIKNIQLIFFPYRIELNRQEKPDRRLFQLVRAWYDFMRARDPWRHRNQYIRAKCIAIHRSAFVLSEEQARHADHPRVLLPPNWDEDPGYDTEERDFELDPPESLRKLGKLPKLVKDTGSPSTAGPKTPPAPISTGIENDLAYGKIPDDKLRELLEGSSYGGQWLYKGRYINFGPRNQ